MNKKDTKKAVINGGKRSGRALKLLCELHETFIQVCELHEKQIAALEQKLEQTEKDLADYQFNYPKIKELEQTNNKLLDVINNQDVKIADLEKKNEELTERLEDLQEQNSEMFNTIALQEQQIEKMQCCENCKRYKPCITCNETIGNDCDYYIGGNVCNNWQLN